MLKSAPVSLLLTALLASTPLIAASQTKTYSPEEAQAIHQMEALQSEVGRDKRTFIDRQLALDPETAAKFWPVYDAHQAGLADLNRRRLDNVIAYARAWNADSLDDTAAKALAKEALSIEKDEVTLMKRTFDRAAKAISPSKAARYLQVEAKIRALVRYEQASRVPLVQ